MKQINLTSYVGFFIKIVNIASLTMHHCDYESTTVFTHIQLPSMHIFITCIVCFKLILQSLFAKFELLASIVKASVTPECSD